MKSKRAKPPHALARIPKAVPDPDARRVLGRARGDRALFPVPPPVVGLPHEYATTLSEIKKRVSKARVSAALAANAAMVLLYWDIGQIILARQGEEGWGAKVIDRLAFDLREAFPDMDGLSSRNLKYVRALPVAWPDPPIVQRVVARLPAARTNAARTPRRSGNAYLLYVGTSTRRMRCVVAIDLELEQADARRRWLTGANVNVDGGLSVR